MTNEATVLVRINKGFGSHTLLVDDLDGDGKKVKTPILHRWDDESPFLLPYSNYAENKAKYIVCDPVTGQQAEPIMQPANSVSMKDKMEAASKKSSGRKPQTAKVA